MDSGARLEETHIFAGNGEAPPDPLSDDLGKEPQISRECLVLLPEATSFTLRESPEESSLTSRSFFLLLGFAQLGKTPLKWFVRFG